LPTEIIKVSRAADNLAPASDDEHLAHIVVPRGYRAILIRAKHYLSITPDVGGSGAQVPHISIAIVKQFVASGLQSFVPGGAAHEEDTGQTSLIYYDKIGYVLEAAVVGELEFKNISTSRYEEDFLDEEKVGGGNSIQAWTIGIHEETISNDTVRYAWWYEITYMLEWIDTGRKGSKLPSESAQMLIGGLA